jgi:hypothetical protein
MVCIGQGFEKYAPVCRPACATDDDCAKGTICVIVDAEYDRFPPACFSPDVHELCLDYQMECLGLPDRCADGTILEKFFETSTACASFERIRCPKGCETLDGGIVPIGRCN